MFEQFIQGIIPPKEEWDLVREGQITEKIYGEVLRYYSKSAKLFRDGSGVNRVEKDYRYTCKSLLLKLFTPIEIHFVERDKIKNIYTMAETPYGAEEIKLCSPHYMEKDYYWYYKIGDYTFHSPCQFASETEIPKEYAVKQLDELYVSSEDTESLYCTEFCELVMEMVEKQHPELDFEYVKSIRSYAGVTNDQLTLLHILEICNRIGKPFVNRVIEAKVQESPTQSNKDAVCKAAELIEKFVNGEVYLTGSKNSLKVHTLGKKSKPEDIKIFQIRTLKIYGFTEEEAEELWKARKIQGTLI